MARFRGEGVARGPTPANNVDSRVNKTILTQAFTRHRLITEANRLNRLAQSSPPNAELVGRSIGALLHYAGAFERMGSEIGFANALLAEGHDPEDVMSAWDKKLAIDRRERLLRRTGLPGYTSLSAQIEEDVTRDELASMTRSYREMTERRTGARVSTVEEIYTAQADTEEIGLEAVNEMLFVRTMREERADELSEPFVDTPGESALAVSYTAGLARQNQRWIGAVVEDEEIPPDHAEQLITNHFEGISSVDIDASAGVTMEDARQFAVEHSIFDSSLDPALEATFDAGESLSDAHWLETLLEDDDVSASHLGSIAAAVAHDSD